METAYVRSPRDVLAHFGATEARGLSDSQVEASRLKHGRNGMIHNLFSLNDSKRSLISRQPWASYRSLMSRC